MNTNLPIIEEISVEMLSRYIDMRRSINAETKIVLSFTSMLALLQQCGDDKLDVDPLVLGHVNEMNNICVMKINESLDDFIYIVQAEQKLEQIDNERAN